MADRFSVNWEDFKDLLIASRERYLREEAGEEDENMPEVVWAIFLQTLEDYGSDDNDPYELVANLYEKGEYGSIYEAIGADAADELKDENGNWDDRKVSERASGDGFLAIYDGSDMVVVHSFGTDGIEI